MQGQRTGKQSRGETEPGRKVEMVRPRRRNGEEQQIEKIPEECWVYGILCWGPISVPLHVEVQNKGLGGGEGREGKETLEWVGSRQGDRCDLGSVV